MTINLGTVTSAAGLNTEIVAADAAAANSGTYVISLGTNISLGSTALEAFNLPQGVTVDLIGNGFTLNGGGTQRGLFVYAGALDIQSLTLANMTAQGGTGGPGGFAGGAGAGFGGGLFVGANVATDPGNVTLAQVAFVNDKAVGGTGGSGVPGPSGGFGGGGGGGGLGGNGGRGHGPGARAGAAGGGGGIGGNGGNPPANAAPGIGPDAPGGAAGGALGGASGGGGGGNTSQGGGGGGGGVGGGGANG